MDKPIRSGDLTTVTCWIERWGAGQHLPRHRHPRAYLTVVLSGGYEECGSRGRYRVRPGDVLVHDVFDSHLNRFADRDTHLLNLALPGLAPGFGLGRIADPDELMHAAARGPAEAGHCLREQLAEAECGPEDWPDLLACELLANPGCPLGRWADSHGFAAETISRGFGRVFAISPAAFRLEARARHAFVRIIAGHEPLTAIAAETGFADSAHMSRAVRALTGFPPGHWRKSNSFKT
ncbi:MAG: AraC family transcriptional regulator [Steroidobacteraceae bacterium]